MGTVGVDIFTSTSLVSEDPPLCVLELIVQATTLSLSHPFSMQIGSGLLSQRTFCCLEVPT